MESADRELEGWIIGHCAGGRGIMTYYSGGINQPFGNIENSIRFATEFDAERMITRQFGEDTTEYKPMRVRIYEIQKVSHYDL